MSNLEITSYDLSDLKFAIVDNNDFSRKLITNILWTFNIRNIYGWNHADAISGLTQHSPEILICDCGFPSNAGLKLVRYIRQPDSPLNSSIAVIMTSSLATAARISQARGAGIDQYLVKPLSPTLVYQNIVRCIESSRPIVRIPDYSGPNRRTIKSCAKPSIQEERRKG
ncbi:response regulator [Rhodospirillales bacterium]|nr:response regulator [Rhodospirillales bacterium]